ncbi:MAG: hypothetical protein H0W28_04625 [Pyrinomonadaceae bacterium]|nr:hypothetical protein [Pyrinomonadaceae bacterium]
MYCSALLAPSRAKIWVGNTVGEMLDAIGTLPSQKRIKEFVITSEMGERRRAIPGEGLTSVDGAA